ncbi:MAG: DUF3341 domain-containing protein [Cyclobacteriaceae bacterium]|nr:DUF3341 domain-containing protein [Cyclobacteriaceae bacterium]
MKADKNFVLGVYEDEDILIKAIKATRSAGIKIQEVYSPFPVHGIEDALGYGRSKMPIVAFMFGFLGTVLALVMQYGMMGFDWPMIIGGKDFVALPPFIPVTFELTVLLAALGMVGTFMVINDLKPYNKPRIYDLRITDDKHVMAIDLGVNKVNKNEITKILQKSGAIEVNDKNFD